MGSDSEDLKEENVINLREDFEPDFRIQTMEEEVLEEGPGEGDDLEKIVSAAPRKVRVKFDKFVTLIATHDYEEVFEKYLDEDIIVSTDLLTDLANSHQEKEESKFPMMFLMGAIIGIVITWILLKT